MRIQIKPETMKTNPKIRIIVPFVIGFLIIGSCIKERPYAPDITTASITAVTSTNAKSGGAISDDGGVPITARGVCWMEYSYTSSPTIEDKKTSDGSGTGTFQSSITGLTVGKKYSVRAYATTRLGTVYGQELSFSTETTNQYLAKTTTIYSTANPTGYNATSVASYRSKNTIKTGKVVINVDHSTAGTYTITLYHPDAPNVAFATWTLNPGQWLLTYNSQTLIIGNDWGIQVKLTNNSQSAINFLGNVSIYSIK